MNSAAQPLDAGRRSSQDGAATFSLSNRLYRGLWVLAWWLLAAWTPPPFKPWRRVLLNLFGAKLARSANVYGSARIWYPPNLVMESFACLGPKATCYCMAPITLGAYALVSQGGHLCAGTHRIDGPDFQLVVRPIHIGANAWIAAEAFVGPGVTVGEGAVLGARAVAMRSLEPWTVYSGNPAAAIRSRPIIKRLSPQ